MVRISEFYVSAKNYLMFKGEVVEKSTESASVTTTEGTVEKTTKPEVAKKNDDMPKLNRRQWGYKEDPYVIHIQ